MMIYVLIALLVAVLIYRWFTQRKLPPGPWGLPVLGYLPFLNPKAPHETLTDLARKYGKIYGLHLGSIYTVVLSDPAMILTAFSKDKVTGRAPLYVTHGIMGGYGIICAEGNMWRVHRKFTAKCLRLFGATKASGFKTQVVEELILREVQECLDSFKENSVVDPGRSLQHGVGSVMCQLVFGTTWDKENQTWLWLQHLQEVGTKLIGVAGPLNFLPFLRFFPTYKKAMNFLLDGKYKTHKIYAELIQNQKRLCNTDADPENVIQAFLSELESTNDAEYFTDAQFHHLLADIFGAGLDTTLTTLRWFFLYMAAYPNVQEQIQHELDNVLDRRHPILDDMQQLPLTQAAIAETQRIRSVVPLGIPHATTDDLELFGYFLPKGTMVVPLQWAIHMNPTVWNNPEEFNPRRFLNEEMKFTKPKDFIPFQLGKRMCLGEDLANMIMFLFTSSVLQQFEVSAPEGVDLVGEIGISLTPKDQILSFRSRSCDT
ncbi:hypothetical protein RN001_012784 [Aquatica leii]|uniref:Cytochrome P450 n=1 Tax=Aquatica leii TaxID=1421715 RepID=A0AAN7SDH7_9COLE|nr:hypothetical protein RN001_012784 [Aquatica leii]